MNSMEYKDLGGGSINDSISIYNCDCMDLLKQTPDNYYSLAIVDPPYGIGFDKKIREKKVKNWDSAIPNDDYFIELQRVSKNQIIWGGNYFPFLWSKGCRGFIFWNKDVNFGTYSAGELAYTSFDKPANYHYYAWNGLADGIRGRNKKHKTIHPTQKPVQIYEWLLHNYAEPNQKILDTHLGSGSIAIAIDNVNKIEKMNLTLTACELDPDYFKAAMKRIEQQTAQQTIF